MISRINFLLIFQNHSLTLSFSLSFYPGTPGKAFSGVHFQDCYEAVESYSNTQCHPSWESAFVAVQWSVQLVLPFHWIVGVSPVL